MKTFKLADMKGGWFVGDFEPSLYKTKNAEVAIKTYKAGSIESSHYHPPALLVHSTRYCPVYDFHHTHIPPIQTCTLK